MPTNSKRYDSGQLRAIEASGGHYLVLAPPGCGKTDILAERVAHALQQGVKPEQMLCLTFTNRASRGMRDRVLQRMGADAHGIFVGNVHRYCSNFLFRNNLVPQNTCIIDDDDQTDILVTHNADFFTKARGGVNRDRVNRVIDVAGHIAQRRLNQPQQALFVHDDQCKLFFDLASSCSFDWTRVPEGNHVVEAALFYQDYKRQHGLLDFDDILIQAYEALRGDTARQFARYPWVQVDEVQDLNNLQMAIIDQLTDASGPFTAMYLGDEQQAIFSFLGAKLEQLNQLKSRCAGHVLHLGNNYRSPRYLLEVFNTYAEKELHVDPALLPQSSNSTPKAPLDLILTCSPTVEDEDARIARMVSYYMNFDDERMALLVPTNAAADGISYELERLHIPNFKISGRDMFKSKSYKTLAAFFCCAAAEFGSMAWVRLLYGIGAFRAQADAREFVSTLKDLMMTPRDLLRAQTGVDRFVQLVNHSEVVCFDTETTGLDVNNDHIVQIAAFKVRAGCKVPGSDFEIFLQTDRQLPNELGNVPNPMVKAYDAACPVPRAEGLRRFLDYVGDDPLLGHNVDYDYRILRSNVAHELHEEVTFEVIDTLRLARLVAPDLHQYKLDYLIHAFGLEGQNSHMAGDDVAATWQLALYCRQRVLQVLPRQYQFLNTQKVANVRKKLELISPLFERVEAILYQPVGATGHTIADEFREVHEDLLKLKLIKSLEPKFSIFLSYIQNEWVDSESGDLNLSDQICRHINDMTASINEGDLVNSTELMTDRVFVMTVHKAKGLEFENVVILGANDGAYPFYRTQLNLNSQDPNLVAQGQEEWLEDARKFYVALTRAKRRICVSFTSRNAYGFSTTLTPFMRSITPYFHQGRAAKP